jgi:hypothetical protein
METKEPDGSPEPPPATISGTFDLNLLLADGHDALRPDPDQRIVDVGVCRAVHTWNNASHDTLISEADDVFRTPGLQPQNLAGGATAAQATVRLVFADVPGPAFVEIQNLHKARINRPTLARRILHWFLKRGLVSPGASLINQVLIAIAIALAACNAIFDDDSLDDDNDDDHKTSFCAPV